MYCRAEAGRETVNLGGGEVELRASGGPGGLYRSFQGFADLHIYIYDSHIAYRPIYVLLEVI